MSIASRITSIENHIENAYDSLSYMGETTTDKNIENISGLVDNIYNKLPKVSNSTASDNVILYPTLKGRIDSTLKGQTGQDTTDGNQLIDFANKTATGYSFANDTLVYESSQRAYASIDWYITDLVKNNPSKKIKFSYESIDISNQAGAVVQLAIAYNDDSSTIFPKLLNHDLTNNYYQIPNDTSNISAVRFSIFSNGTTNNTNNYSVTIVKPQLQFGETEKDYEKYTGRNSKSKSKL